MKGPAEFSLDGYPKRIADVRSGRRSGVISGDPALQEAFDGAWSKSTPSTPPTISETLGSAVSGPVTTESYTMHTDDQPDE